MTVPDSEFIAHLDCNVAAAEVVLAADVAKLSALDQRQKQRVRGQVRATLKLLSTLARIRAAWISAGYEH